MAQANVFRVYADMRDGRGVVRVNDTDYKVKTRAESEASRILNGKTKASRSYVITVRREERN